MAERPYYLRTVEETLASLTTTPQWISPEERQERLGLYGKNVLKETAKKSQLAKFFEQFKDLMIILLIVSAGISRYLGDVRTTIILAAIVIINALIGYLQEAKAERLLASLKKMVYSQAKVVERGELKEMSNELLVPGDIVHITEWDSIPADLRIIEQKNLQTNDFSLTGEPSPKKKHVHPLTDEVEIGDRTNLVFMGTTVAMWNGVGVVIWTGMWTQIGKIAQMSANTPDDLSPLQKEINNIASKLSIWTVILWTLLFGAALWMDWSTKESLLFAIGIAAAMVPQWLPAQISVALASAAGRLAKRLALVKKLSAVETLGAVNVICTDKTWTLTKNEMTVEKVIIGLQQYEVTGTGYEPLGQVMKDEQTQLDIGQRERIFFETGVAASNARISAPDEGHATWYTIGDPTEWALITLAAKAGVTPQDLNQVYPELLEFSFDSVRKMMSSVRQVAHGTYRIYVKWSLQSMLEKTTHIFDNSASDHKIREITAEDKKKMIAYDDQLAGAAMRNLAYAYKDISVFDAKMSMEEAESELVLMGLVSMMDPPREEVAYAIEAARDAHIKIIVITGDYALTAKAIAMKIWLLKEGEDIPVISWADLRTMPDIAITTLMHEKDSLIFSRTSPEDKVRIVELCKRLWWIVAVTGDGVNDAPALKNADIGVAMWKTGTDIAKDAAEIILLDDSFATLVEAIREGRVIYQNLNKTILSCISTNGGELFLVLLSLAFNILNGRQLAITAVQILAIDLIGEMSPLAALTWDPAQPGIMKKAARDTKKHVLHRWTIIDLIITGLLMWVFAYIAHWAYYVSAWAQLGLVSETHMFHQKAQTLAYLTILFCQFTNIMSRRAGFESVWTSYFWSNKKLFVAFGISLTLVLWLIYSDLGNTYFGFAPLYLANRGIPISLWIIYLVIKEALKPRFRKLCQEEASPTVSQTLQTV